MAKFVVIFCVFSAATVFMMAAAGKGKTANPAPTKSQGGAPSNATQPFLVMTGSSIEEAVKKLQSGNGTQSLISADTLSCRVSIQHEKDVVTNQAEVHDAADDIFIILEGTATYVLGGKLDTPKAIQSGEWRASNIVGGKEYKLAKGDMLIVPRGTPHRRTTAGLDVTFMIIKAFAPTAK
jgi:mannose-6-phosphate isomerase-like protein (cupin superfamily)